MRRALFVTLLLVACDTSVEPTLDPSPRRSPESGLCDQGGEALHAEWPLCASACDGLAVDACIATPGCQPVFDEYAGRETFARCWATAGQDEVARDDCASFGTLECMHHDSCRVYSTYECSSDTCLVTFGYCDGEDAVYQPPLPGGP